MSTTRISAVYYRCSILPTLLFLAAACSACSKKPQSSANIFINSVIPRVKHVFVFACFATSTNGEQVFTCTALFTGSTRSAPACGWQRSYPPLYKNVIFGVLARVSHDKLARWRVPLLPCAWRLGPLAPCSRLPRLLGSRTVAAKLENLTALRKTLRLKTRRNYPEKKHIF